MSLGLQSINQVFILLLCYVTGQKTWTYFSSGCMSSSSHLPCKSIMMINVVFPLHSFLSPVDLTKDRTSRAVYVRRAMVYVERQ